MRALILVLLASTAVAQGFEMERVQLNAGAKETWLAQTGDGLDQMQLRVALLGHYQHRPLILTVDGQPDGAYIGSRWTAHLLAAYGIHKFVEASVQVPVVLAQQGDDLRGYGLPAPTPTAFGALWLGVRGTFLRQRDAHPLDLGLSVNVGLPTGDAAALTRDPGAGVALAPKLGAGRAFGPVRLGVELGALVRGATAPVITESTTQVGSQFNGALVVSTYDLPVHAELAARVVAPFTAAPASVEVTAAVRYTFLKQLELSLLGGPGIGKTPGTPAFRVLFGLAWTPDFNDRKAEAAPLATPAG
ncbi:MAG: hypothetical protein DI536_22335 [Archangium gephyra]|uniref:Uncharacterized protein n=1 Tax=Archangium gephyra TaxID=48 RepID=A0A2W5T8J7_9BACT|nr:MAG: hypothetical protein DI536_22335 [Archangium gephyra]